MINGKRIEEIENITSKLLFKHHILKPSVPVDSLAVHEGISLTSHDLGDSVSGILVVKDGKGVIGYNVNHPKVRRRFTIAHELGHYILHRHTANREEVFIDKDFIVKFRDKSNTYSKAELKQESEANSFAASLLMPKKLIDEELDNEIIHTLNESDLINFLAKRFEVSALAMTYRLSNLNLFS